MGRVLVDEGRLAALEALAAKCIGHDYVGLGGGNSLPSKITIREELKVLDGTRHLIPHSPLMDAMRERAAHLYDKRHDGKATALLRRIYGHLGGPIARGSSWSGGIGPWHYEAWIPTDLAAEIRRAVKTQYVR